MYCSFCNRKLTNDDDKCWSHVASTFIKMTNPIGIIKGVYNVGKTIYYDFSNLPQTDEYLYCQTCKVYFVSCYHCGKLNCIGSNIMTSPKKIKCTHCQGEYVYATHPDPDVDHGY